MASDSVISPFCAFSGTVATIVVVFADLILPAALGNAIPVTRSRSLPVIVTSAPFFTGFGAATSSVGTTVLILPAGILTPELVTRLTSPSVALAGTITLIDLPS